MLSPCLSVGSRVASLCVYMYIVSMFRSKYVRGQNCTVPKSVSGEIVLTLLCLMSRSLPTLCAVQLHIPVTVLTSTRRLRSDDTSAICYCQSS